MTYFTYQPVLPQSNNFARRQSRARSRRMTRPCSLADRCSDFVQRAAVPFERGSESLVDPPRNCSDLIVGPSSWKRDSYWSSLTYARQA